MTGADDIADLKAQLQEMIEDSRTHAEAILKAEMFCANAVAMEYLVTFRLGPCADSTAQFNRVAQLMRLVTEQANALGRLEHRASRQKVTVEHINVQGGGQAFVGALGSARPDGREGSE